MIPPAISNLAGQCRGEQDGSWWTNATLPAQSTTSQVERTDVLPAWPTESRDPRIAGLLAELQPVVNALSSSTAVRM